MPRGQTGRALILRGCIGHGKNFEFHTDSNEKTSEGSAGAIRLDLVLGKKEKHNLPTMLRIGTAERGEQSRCAQTQEIYDVSLH